MSASLRQQRRMNVAEFVEMIRPYPDEERWERLDGEPVLMAPQSKRHQMIVANVMNAWRKSRAPTDAARSPASVS